MYFKCSKILHVNQCLYLDAFVNRITKSCELELLPFKVIETCFVTYALWLRTHTSAFRK